jgi:hypothetical protein
LISHYCGGITPDWFLTQPVSTFFTYRSFVDDIQRQNREANRRG